MASPRSQASEVSDAKPTDALGEHIRKIKAMVDTTLKANRLIGEAKGNGSLKSGGHIKLADGKEISSNDVRKFASTIHEALKQIPRMIREKEQREKAERKARRGTPRAQAPTQFTKALVEFFNSIDLGKGPSGKRLQDEADMQLFFKSGVGKLTFGVSLFNVWGNIHKLRTGSNKVTLSDSERRHIADALRSLREEKVKQNKTEDIAMLDAGQLQNKDYMSILSFYRNKEAGDLTRFSDGVNTMSQITKDLNTKYGEQLKAARPKAEKVVRNKPSTPVRKSAPAAPAKTVASPAKASKLPAAPAMPAAPAKSAASPSKGKKGGK
jgi:hypothetical protein